MSLIHHNGQVTGNISFLGSKRWKHERFHFSNHKVHNKNILLSKHYQGLFNKYDREIFVGVAEEKHSSERHQQPSNSIETLLVLHWIPASQLHITNLIDLKRNIP